MNERRDPYSRAVGLDTQQRNTRRTATSLVFGAGLIMWCASASTAPVTLPDAATTEEETPVNVEVLSNDFDDSSCLGPCPPPLREIGTVSPPANGTVEIDEERGRFGEDEIRYTPTDDFFGTDTFTYTAFDFNGVESGPTTVTITVTPVNDEPVTAPDAATTRQGTPVTIAVLANDTDVDGDVLRIASVTEPDDGTVAITGTEVTYTPDPEFSGTDRFRYRASDGTDESEDTVVTVTVTPSVAPRAVIAGGSRSIPDSDGLPGENVRLDGSESTDPDGTIVSYEWFDSQQSLLGTGAIIEVRLPDGDNTIRLVVTDDDDETDSASVTLRVAEAPPRTPLADLPDLTPNQRSVATALDSLCLRLSESDTSTEGQSDLLDRCNGIVLDDDPTRQTTALDELGAQDLNAMRMQTLAFSRHQSTGAMDRLMALRSGARGLSVASGLDVIVDDSKIPREVLESALQQFLRDGASADDGVSSYLQTFPWGTWVRFGNGSGDKDGSLADGGFEADHWSLTGGIDYRMYERKAVLGLALGLGETDATFKPAGEGGVDTSEWSLSVYGAFGPIENFYVDGVLTYGGSSIDTERRIHYVDAGGQIDRSARGSTDGSSLSVSVAAGYDLLFGSLTIGPTVGISLVDASVDGFQESGASGLDLVYEEQDFESLTANVGIRITGAWNLGWAVVLPQLRGEAVREFRDEEDTFGVRFANDPFADGANATPRIIVTSDALDPSYWRFAAGISAQFIYGFSAYVEYQRLEGFDLVDFADLAFGVRVQYSYR